MSKADALNQRLGEEPSPKRVTVKARISEDEPQEVWVFEAQKVTDIIVTSSGAVFIVDDGELFRYSAEQVQEMVYDDHGLDQEEGEDDE